MDNLKRKWLRIRFVPSMIVGFVLAIIYRPFLKKKIIMVGGHVGEIYDDNSKAMYQFLSNFRKEFRIYWCYSRKRNYDLNVLKNGKSVRLGSIADYFFYFNASIVFYSHSNSSDIAPVVDHLRVKQPFKVALGHGVDGLKEKDKKPIEFANMFSCTSPFEKKIKNKFWKIPKDSTVVTGIARFDKYHLNNKYHKVKEILYLPTWRDWEYDSNNAQFKLTKSYKKIANLMKDETLQNLLKKNDIKMKICLHPFFKKFRGDFYTLSTEFMRITSENISELIQKSDLLITDYSSVAFDFFYLKKPVIFYQYDQRKFLQLRGSYIDFESDLFGPVCKTQHELVKEICDEILNKNYIPMNELRKKYFAFEDRNNCARIFEYARKLSNI